MKSQNIYIEFNFKNLQNLSDNTLRKLLKEYSKITRKILLDEIDFILLDLDLPYRQRQSLRAIIINNSISKPNFYIEKIEKGSLTVIGVIAGATIYILNNTLGKSFERAWGNSNLGKDVEDLLLKSLNKISKYLKNRNSRINELTNQFKGKIIGDSYIVKSINKNNSQKITMEIEGINNPEKPLDDEIIDNDFLLNDIKKKIKSIEKNKNE